LDRRRGQGVKPAEQGYLGLEPFAHAFLHLVGAANRSGEVIFYFYPQSGEDLAGVEVVEKFVGKLRRAPQMKSRALRDAAEYSSHRTTWWAERAKEIAQARPIKPDPTMAGRVMVPHRVSRLPSTPID
jgi:hypothetical protein